MGTHPLNQRDLREIASTSEPYCVKNSWGRHFKSEALLTFYFYSCRSVVGKCRSQAIDVLQLAGPSALTQQLLADFTNIRQNLC